MADAEELDYIEIQNLYDYWLKDPELGHAYWCCLKRNKLPQKPVLKYMENYDFGVINESKNSIE